MGTRKVNPEMSCYPIYKGRTRFNWHECILLSVKRMVQSLLLKCGNKLYTYKNTQTITWYIYTYYRPIYMCVFQMHLQTPMRLLGPESSRIFASTVLDIGLYHTHIHEAAINLFYRSHIYLLHTCAYTWTSIPIKQPPSPKN